jgi:ubiquinone/menaquinone biosynthesis C-methylase UbiE
MSAAVAAVSANMLWRRSQRKIGEVAPLPAGQARRMLELVAPLVRLPTSPGQEPKVLVDGSGLLCRETGLVYPYRGRVLHLLEEGPALTVTQQALDTPFTAWFYDRYREALLKLFSMPSFAEEVAAIQSRLQVSPGDAVLDLACGQGVFTVEWAKRAGPEGLVIGVDISQAMLARAAYHVSQWGLDNVLLVRGDAHRLPLADSSVSKVNCSGGFHQFPDLARALEEIARVSAAGSRLTASTFAESPEDPRADLKRWVRRQFDFHFVPVDWLGEQLSSLGYTDYDWAIPGGWFGYTSARKVIQKVA